MIDPLAAYFRVLREGPADRKGRDLATDLSRALLTALEDVNPQDYGSPSPDGSTFSVNVGELLNYPQLKDLELHFQQVAAGDPSMRAGREQRATFKRKGDKSIVVIYVSVPKKMSGPQWKSTMIDQAADVFERSQELFWHEFTHYLDVKKIKDPKKVLSKDKLDQAKMGAKDYYNGPLEVNAYIQQGLSRVENYLKRAHNKEKAKEIMGSSAQEFLKRVRTFVDKSFHKHMTPDTEKKLKKKTAQMWADVMGGENK